MPGMTQAAEILEAALKLDDAERSQLVEALAASLYGQDLGDDWEREIQQRIADVDSGQVIPVSGEAVLTRLEQRFGGR
jgi:putative addiction module component (TIGR02574 family)